MRYFRAFISGLVIPSIILPFVLFIALSLGKSQVLAIPFLHFIPLIWGIWNILYFAFIKDILPGELNLRLLITGAVLGFLIAFYGVFWLNLPEIIGLPNQIKYLPILIAPILYAILWKFCVKPLNDLLGLKTEEDK